MVPHQLTKVDVVALVNRRKACCEDIPNATPALALRSGLATGAGALAIPRNDGFKVAVHQGASIKNALARFIEQTSVGVERNVGWAVTKTNPGRSHDIGVDVIDQVVNRQILHTKI